MRMQESYYGLELFIGNDLSSPKNKRFIPHVYHFKTKEQWTQEGFRFPVDKYGHPTKKITGKNQYRFYKLVSINPQQIEAIQAGKRFLLNPECVARCFIAGIHLDEFFELPKHIEHYCYARLAQEGGDLVKADLHFTAAVNGDPANIGYRQYFYQTRLKVHGAKVIPDEVNFFANDMDSMLHSGRVDEWLNTFFAIKDYRHAAKLIVHIEKCLTELIEGKRGKPIYGGQSAEWINHKKNTFIEKICKWEKSPRYKPLMAQLEIVGWPYFRKQK